MAQILIINGLDISHIVSYEVTRNTLLGENSGRDTTGNNHIDLIGIFPSIQCTVGIMDSNQMSRLLTELDKYTVNVTFFDPRTNRLYANMSMYVPDYTVSMKKYKINPKYNQFSFELVANNKRG